MSFARISKAGSSKSSGLGSLFLSHLTASLTAFFLFFFGIKPAGIGIPASLVASSMVRSSKFSISGLLFLNQSTAFSMKFFLSFGVMFLGIGKPVSLEKASIVGTSKLSKSGLFSRNHCTALSMASFFTCLGLVC